MTPRGSSARYRRTPANRFYLSRSSTLVNPASLDGVACVVSDPALSILNTCSQFQTLEAHFDRLSAQAGFGRLAETRALFQELIDTGLLISETEIVERAARRASPHSQHPQIEWLAIPTSGRVSELREALESYLGNLTFSHRSCAVFVADGSRCVADRQRYREMLASIADCGQPIYYAGEEEKAAYIDALASQRALPLDTLSFALGGSDRGLVSTGANRNAILLQTLGSLLVSVDDDSSCRTACVPGRGAAAGVTFSGPTDLSEMFSFEDRASALRYVEAVSLDFVGAHAQLLGRSLPELCAEFLSEAVDLGPASDHVLNHLYSGLGRIVVTTCGLAGDAGRQGAPTLVRDGRSRERFSASPEALETAISSREVVYQPVSLAVTHAGPLMAGAIGLDNRKILPPFFPFCRSEDAILSRVISKCFTDAYFGRLPFTIDHLPRAGRTYGPSVDTRLADIVIAFVSTFEWPEYMVGGEDSLQALGSHLESLASLPAERFSLLQQELLWQRTSAMIRALEEFLARNPRGPRFGQNTLSAKWCGSGNRFSPRVTRFRQTCSITFH